VKRDIEAAYMLANSLDSKNFQFIYLSAEFYIESFLKFADVMYSLHISESHELQSDTDTSQRRILVLMNVVTMVFHGGIESIWK